MPAERAPYGGGQGGEGGEEAAGGGADAGRQGQDGRTAAVKQCGQGRFDAPRTNEFTLLDRPLCHVCTYDAMQLVCQK